MAQGVPPEKLIVRAYGTSRPLATNRTREGRAMNRRIILSQQTGARELQTDLRSEASQQTGTRELPAYLRSEANQQTGTRELTTDLRSEVNQQNGTR